MTSNKNSQSIKKTYYDILEIEKDADLDAIKKAYRRLAMKYHPDRNKDDPNAETKFKEVAQAYETLSDESKKSRYDMKLKYGGDNGEGIDDTFDGDETFGDAFDMFHTIFKQFPVSFFPMEEFFPSQQPKIDIEFTFHRMATPPPQAPSRAMPFSFIPLNNHDFSNMQDGFNLFNHLFTAQQPPQSAASSKQLPKFSINANNHLNSKKNKNKNKNKKKVEKHAAEAEMERINQEKIQKEEQSAQAQEPEPEPEPDYDLIYNINVKLEDIYQRKVKIIQIQRHSANSVDEEKEIKEIEIHFDEREKVYPNEGDYQKGNLYIYIHPKKHEYYEVVNHYDLVIHYTLTVDEIMEMRALMKQKENAANAANLLYLYPSTKIKLNSDENWCIACDIREISRNKNAIQIKERGLWNHSTNTRGDFTIVFDCNWSLGDVSNANKETNNKENGEYHSRLFEMAGEMRNNGEERWDICNYFAFSH